MERFDVVRLLPLLAPLVLLQLGLLVAALWDLYHRERVRGGNKIVWAGIIVLVNLLGPLAYYLFGRED